jgi:hypothetical protein
LRPAARLAERTGQKIVLQRQLADLRVQHLQIHRRRRFSRSAAEQPGGTVKHLSLPSTGCGFLEALEFGNNTNSH